MSQANSRRRFQVFISSTFEDLRDEREEIMQSLLRINCIPAGMEMFPAANTTQWQLIERMIDDSDYVVVVVAQRYGSVDETGISYTQKEFEYAERTNRPILAFPRELNAEESAKLDAKLAAFRQRLTSGPRHVRFWRTPAQLAGYIAADLVGALNSPPYPEGWVRGGYAVSDHIQVLRDTVAAVMRNYENSSAQVGRIDTLVSTMSGQMGALLALVSGEVQSVKAMSHYMRVQQLKLDLQDRNPMFAAVADRLLVDPLMTLEHLSKAHVSVPEYQIGQANDLLISAVKARFDAVSYDDLDFWMSEAKNDSKYRHAVYDAARRPADPIVATRIFVLPKKVIDSRANDIARVMSEQMSQSLALAIVVAEDVSDAAEPNAALDFALFDSGNAISYFRRYRKFDVTFRRDGHTENDEEIDRQLRTYRLLLANCWLATARFVALNLAAGDESALLLRATSRIRALEGIKYAHANRLFPIVIDTEGQVLDALSDLSEIHNRARSRT